jgi:hypothetical protein
MTLMKADGFRVYKPWGGCPTFLVPIANFSEVLSTRTIFLSLTLEA